MGSVALHLRAAARARWRWIGAIALLFGLTSGLATASWASARRTTTAYERFLEASDATDLAIDYGDHDPDVAHTIDRLPEVAASSSYVAFNAAPWDAQRGPDLSKQFETVGSLDGRYFRQDRVAVVRGRLPHPDRAGEVAVNEHTVERAGIDVGDRLTLGLVLDEDLEAAEDPTQLRPRQEQDVVVVGEVVFGDEVIQDDNDILPRLLATPAFTAAHRELAGYAWQGLALRPGVDPDRAAVAARRVVATAFADEPDGAFVLVRDAREDVARVERAILPQVSALLIAAALVAAVALVLSIQASGRLVRWVEPDLRSVRATGATMSQLVAIGVAPALVAVAAGLGVSIVFAWIVSPLSPLGSLHAVEPSPGFDLDAVAVIGGTLALAAITAAGAVLAGVRVARGLRTAAETRVGRPSLVVRALGRVGAPPEVIAGARASLVATPGQTAAPIRSITIGTAVATAALVAALCFGASLQHLVDEPPLYGWNWDIALIDDGGYGDIDRTLADRLLSADPDVDGWAGIGLASTDIDGRTVPLVGIDLSSGVAPAVRSGRAPHVDDEIAFGRRTMDRLGVSEGDLVEFGPDRLRLRVVGTVSLPAIGQVRSSHPSPGEGAMVTLPTLGRAIGLGDEGLPTGVTVAAIDLREGVDDDAAGTRLAATAADLGSYPGSVGVTGVPRPGEIVNADEVTLAPLLMAGVLMATALVSLGLALVGNVRRRRDELAVLRALGLTSRQLVTSVLTQSVLVTALGVAVGLPLGVLAGRWTWSAFAEQLSVLDRPVVPVAQLTVTIGVVVVVALLASVVPARLASRVRVLDPRAG